MLPEGIRSIIENQLDLSVKSVRSVGGGSINQTARIESSKGPYFIKWNSSTHYPGMFEAEEKGLHLLRECSGFIVPKVVNRGEVGGHDFLLMEYLESAPPYWNDAGQILANMHRYKRLSNDNYGLDHDNFIGSLKQTNKIHVTWADFFSNERILPQVKIAVDQHRLNHRDAKSAELFCQRITDIFPAEKSSLLHGDLWSGNFMFTREGPAIFDPAVYWGHREMDIAMTKLFGEFDPEFYTGYNEDYPLEKNWEKRIDYCNLYPLLVHVNLFEGSYVNDVRRILQAFN